MARGDQEDEGCDRQSDRECPDHRVVGDGRPSPTVVFDTVLTASGWSRSVSADRVRLLVER